MALELRKESIGIRQAVGEDSTHMIIESDIIVPDIKPDVARVLLLDGDIFTEEVQTTQDKVTLIGTARLKVLYQSDDPEDNSKGISTNISFTRDLEMLDAKIGMVSKAKCIIEHIDYNIINSRKINVRIVVAVSVKVSSEVSIENICVLGGVDNLQILKKSVELNLCTMENTSECNISEFVDIPGGKPSIREILWSDVRLTGNEFKLMDNRVAASAALRISTLYVGDDEERSMQFVENEIPLSQVVEIEDVYEDAKIRTEFEIVRFSTDISEDSDGEQRVLKIDSVLKVNVSGYKKVGIVLIDDAFSPKLRFAVEKTGYVVRSLVNESKSRFSVKDLALVEDDLADIAEVFNISWKAGTPDYRIEDNNVVVEGYISSSVLYLTSDNSNPVASFSKEIPFRQTIEIKDMKPDLNYDLAFEVENLSYSVTSSKGVEMRANISVGLRAFEMIEVPIVTKVSEISEELKTLNIPSYTIYFAQPGDNLWKIAKRYLVTIDELQSNNKLSDIDEIASGTQVLIVKKSS